MRFFKVMCLGLAALAFAAHAEKSTYSVVSIGPAWPMSSEALVLPVDSGITNALNMGWEAKYTLFGLPFQKSGNSFLSGLAFGGQISYNRWVRESDSNSTELNFLGVHALARYYIPPVLCETKPFKLFAQISAGMSIGEHGFSDPDTINRAHAPAADNILITKGIKNLGTSFSIGIDWDIFEISPAYTIVFTDPKSSAWFSLDAAMKF